jgi:hypothetical protein
VECQINCLILHISIDWMLSIINYMWDTTVIKDLVCFLEIKECA